MLNLTSKNCTCTNIKMYFKMALAETGFLKIVFLVKIWYFLYLLNVCIYVYVYFIYLYMQYMHTHVRKAIMLNYQLAYLQWKCYMVKMKIFLSKNVPRSTSLCCKTFYFLNEKHCETRNFLFRIYLISQTNLIFANYITGHS